jgi:hypothetical protein
MVYHVVYYSTADGYISLLYASLDSRTYSDYNVCFYFQGRLANGSLFPAILLVTGVKSEAREMLLGHDPATQPTFTGK